jgi:hypothetical protein
MWQKWGGRYMRSEFWWGDVIVGRNWINLAQNLDKWHAFVNSVMHYKAFVSVR